MGEERGPLRSPLAWALQKRPRRNREAALEHLARYRRWVPPREERYQRREDKKKGKDRKRGLHPTRDRELIAQKWKTKSYAATVQGSSKAPIARVVR